MPCFLRVTACILYDYASLLSDEIRSVLIGNFAYVIHSFFCMNTSIFLSSFGFELLTILQIVKGKY